MSVLEQPRLEHLAPLRQRLVARLALIRRRVRARLLIHGMARLLLEIVAFAAIVFVLDHSLRLGVAARVGLLAAGIVGLGWELWRRVLEPLWMPMDLVALAGALERTKQGRGTELAARVASVLELPRLLETRDPPSAAMIDRAVRRCEESLEKMRFETSLDPKRHRRALGLAAGAVLLPLLLGVVFPATMGLWARRFFAGSREPWPQRTYLEVVDEHDGRIQVPRGEPYVLRAYARSGSVAPRQISLTIESGESTTVQMKVFGTNDFRHDFAVIDQLLRLSLSGGDDDHGPVMIEPVDRPRVTGLQLAAQHPRQASPEMHNFGGDADLSFLMKTRLALSVTANVGLSEIRLHSATAHPGQADIHRADPTHFTVEWIQEEPVKFELELVAADSGLVSLPIPVSVGLKVDQPPRITMAYTGVHLRITPQATIPLTVEGRDDFGVAAMNLTVKDETPDPADPSKLIPHEAAQALYPPPSAPAATAASSPPSAPGAPLVLEREIQLKHDVNVAGMKLPAGALLSLTADGTDDCYTGKQTARSRTVTFRIVAPEELFREILLRQQAERAKFRKQIDEAGKIHEAIQAARDERQTADLARRHRAMQREVLQVATVLSESLVEIKLNALGSPESYDLLERNILTPLKALNDELMNPQTGALDALLPLAGDAGPDAAKVKAILDRQDQMVARMEAILKQMAQWDSFVDVLNQLDEVIKLETQVKDQSRNMQKKDTDSLFEK